MEGSSSTTNTVPEASAASSTPEGGACTGRTRDGTSSRNTVPRPTVERTDNLPPCATTMLRLILDRGPDLAVPPESMFLTDFDAVFEERDENQNAGMIAGPVQAVLRKCRERKAVNRRTDPSARGK